MKLYFAPRSRATRSRWLLEEIGLPYDLVRVDLPKREHQTPEFLALNPLGEVPVLADGDITLFEPAMLCLYLADRFPEKQLAPPPDSAERGPYLQWLFFAEATLTPALMKLFEHAQSPDAQSPGALDAQRARVGALIDVVDKALNGGDFLAGGRFSAADVVMASTLHLANHLKLLEARPRLMQYVLLHCRRPASLRAVS